MSALIWQPGVSLKAMEREAIASAMQFFHNDKASAARSLGVTPELIEERMAEYERDRAAEQERHKQRLAEREAFLRRQRGLDPIPQAGEALAVPMAQARLDVQPTPQAGAQPEMPMRVGTEVQKMPSKQAAPARHAKNR